MAAIHAGRSGKEVWLIDHNKRIGGKIPISGGGRCNFTNLNADWTHFQSANPRFAASALNAFTPQDIIAMLDAHQIAWHEKHLGQLFCDQSAMQIVDMLEKELDTAGVRCLLETQVENIEPEGEMFSLDLVSQVKREEKRSRCKTDYLVLSTGGLSYPALGASDFSLRLARQWGHQIVETAPALDGFVFGPAEREIFGDLEGISLKQLIVSAGQKSFKEDLLLTHKGLSGPAALQASLYWKPGEAVTVNWLPELNLIQELMKRKRKQPASTAEDLLSEYWPKRFLARWQEVEPNFKEALARMSNADIEQLVQRIQNYTFKPVSSTGYHKAEVTRGGVSTSELNQKNMESKKMPHAFFIGETVDITGELGGYNFQWAWASGFVCGQHLSQE